ncbi:DUF6188 family protein [Amycolatopsis sp. H20-H5]|uniref:DUF6188 family protein n=1 Tax=Amycolatopsis sp. H20-H5 TaxID=3046309 RepID=UPI002DB5C4CD|nr:DUF6188 family protein [Amycolatopsis sp. H20-H5]MEC3979563.1 DUF6188 family protein [Amycolatopsis sp. H20-H5]
MSEELPYQGMSVTQLKIDHSLTLLLDGGAQIVIEGVAFLDGVRLDPDRQDVVPALALFEARVRSAVAAGTGELRVEFEDSRRLTVAPDPRYEAWNVAGPGALRVVCVPGGDLTVWS